MLTTILVIVIVFYVLKLLTRYLGPILLLYISKKVAKKFEGQFNSQTDFQDSDTHKNTTFSKTKIPSEKKPVGEYVDFEEIDE